MLFLCFTISSLAQVPKDSLVLVLDNIKFPIDNTRDVPFISVKWVDKTEVIKIDKSKNTYCNKTEIIYIYIKKKYIKKARKELEIK